MITPYIDCIRGIPYSSAAGALAQYALAAVSLTGPQGPLIASAMAVSAYLVGRIVHWICNRLLHSEYKLAQSVASLAIAFFCSSAAALGVATLAGCTMSFITAMTVTATAISIGVLLYFIVEQVAARVFYCSKCCCLCTVAVTASAIRG